MSRRHWQWRAMVAAVAGTTVKSMAAMRTESQPTGVVVVVPGTRLLRQGVVAEATGTEP